MRVPQPSTPKRPPRLPRRAKPPATPAVSYVARGNPLPRVPSFPKGHNLSLTSLQEASMAAVVFALPHLLRSCSAKQTEPTNGSTASSAPQSTGAPLPTLYKYIEPTDPCEKTKNTEGLFAKHKTHVNSVEKAAGLFLESLGAMRKVTFTFFSVSFFLFQKMS